MPRWEEHSAQWREAERFRAEKEYIEVPAKLELAAHAKIESADRSRMPNTGAVWLCIDEIYYLLKLARLQGADSACQKAQPEGQIRAPAPQEVQPAGIVPLSSTNSSFP